MFRLHRAHCPPVGVGATAHHQAVCSAANRPACLVANYPYRRRCMLLPLLGTSPVPSFPLGWPNVPLVPWYFPQTYVHVPVSIRELQMWRSQLIRWTAGPAAASVLFTWTTARQDTADPVAGVGRAFRSGVGRAQEQLAAAYSDFEARVRQQAVEAIPDFISQCQKTFEVRHAGLTASRRP